MVDEIFQLLDMGRKRCLDGREERSYDDSWFD